MRKPSLSLETFVTALAVLGAANGCSKQAEPASAVPEAVAPAASAPAVEQTAAPVAPALPAAQADAPAPPAAAASVVAKPADGARKKDSAGKRSAPGAAPSDNKPVNASCGAGTCTPDMKKGNGN